MDRRREGRKEGMKEKEQEGRRRAVKFSHTWRIFLPSLLSFSSSSSTLSLWCHSMCFTGPCWAEDLRWKTSEFLDVFKGLKSLMCFWRGPCPLFLDALWRSRQSTPLFFWLFCLLTGVWFWCSTTDLFLRWVLQDLTSHTDTWLPSLLFCSDRM